MAQAASRSRPRRHRLRLILAGLACAGVALAACATPAGAGTPGGVVALQVFAAASLAEAFTELGEQFEAAHSGVDVVFNFAGSQALRAQLEQGAVADVFASADAQQMAAAVEAGLVAGHAPAIFARNRLAVILPTANPAGLSSVEDLSRPGLKLVLAAPEVPVGGYARQALVNLNALYGEAYAERVLANVVSNEDNVRQVVAKVQLGEADAGIVYASDAVAAPGLGILPVPDDFNVAAEYPVAVLAAAPHALAAADFVAYVLSPGGQAILQRWGFSPVYP